MADGNSSLHLQQAQNQSPNSNATQNDKELRLSCLALDSLIYFFTSGVAATSAASMSSGGVGEVSECNTCPFVPFQRRSTLS